MVVPRRFLCKSKGSRRYKLTKQCAEMLFGGLKSLEIWLFCAVLNFIQNYCISSPLILPKSTVFRCHLIYPKYCLIPCITPSNHLHHIFRPQNGPSPPLVLFHRHGTGSYLLYDLVFHSLSCFSVICLRKSVPGRICKPQFHHRLLQCKCIARRSTFTRVL
jgi:hypothetical protein